MALADKVQQLDQQIASAVKTALGNVRRELDDRLRQSTESLRERIDGIEQALPQHFLAAEDLAAAARDEVIQSRRDAFAGLASALAALDGADSQAAIFTTLLEQARTHASRTALFLTSPDAAKGWQGRGFGDAAGTLANLMLPYDTGPGWSELAAGRGWVSLSAAELADLASRLECPMARQAVLVPVVLADHLAAALYADIVADSNQELELSALQVLVAAAAAAIEALPLRQRLHHPTFTAAAETRGTGLALWASREAPAAPPAAAAPPAEMALPPEPTPEPAPESSPEPEPVSVLEDRWEELAPLAPPEPPTAPTDAVAPETAKISTDLAEHEPWEETAAEFFSPPTPLTPEPELPAPPAVDVEMELESWDAAPTAPMPALIEEAAALPWPEPPAANEPEDFELPPISDWAEPQPKPVEETPRFEPAATTMYMPEIDLNEDATLLMPRRSVAPPSPPPREPPPEPPAPSPPPRIEEPEEEATHPGRAAYASTRALPKPGGGGAEVRPPSGFEGPGLAFSRGQRPATSEPPSHEEARRLARLLVSEIRLYNEDQVEEGRRNRDIYARLRDEIDRSRRMYEERISVDVRSARDYFTEELVRRLADGDPDALGI